MTVASIFSTLLNSGAQAAEGPSKSQAQVAQQVTQNTFQQEFQQLGQDLQSGNLTAAQADMANLQNSGMLPNTMSTPSASNPIAQDFTQLSADLKAGKLSSAQQDYTALKQEFQTHTLRHDGRHHYQSGTSGSDPISQLMGQLGQALQSGNLTSAQQAYGSLQQDLELLGSGSGSASSPGPVRAIFRSPFRGAQFAARASSSRSRPPIFLHSFIITHIINRIYMQERFRFLWRRSFLFLRETAGGTPAPQELLNIAEKSGELQDLGRGVLGGLLVDFILRQAGDRLRQVRTD